MKALDHDFGRSGIHASVVTSIGRRIVAGDLRPGEILPDQNELSRQLGVSRTVVREATKVLAAKGLVDSRPKRGTVVLNHSHWRLLDPDVLAWQNDSSPSDAFLTDIFEIREIIEPGVARLAAERATLAEAEALEMAFEALAEAQDPETYFQADVKYHETMVAATHNEHLIELARAFTAALRANLRATSQDVRNWKAFVEFSRTLHSGVLDSIRQHDPDGAHAAMLRLLNQSRRGVVEIHSTPPGSKPNTTPSR